MRFASGKLAASRFDFLVMQQVHIFFTHTVKIVFALDGHRLGLDPMTVLPVRPVSGHLAQVDFGIEVGRERISVIAAVAVKNVDVVDFIKIMLLGVRGEYAGHTRVESASQQRRDAGLLVLFAVSPLP